MNEQVDEMYYVLQGEGTIVYEDGCTITLKKDSAAYIPRGLKFRVENARDLEVVIPTGPACFERHHKYINPPHFETKPVPIWPGQGEAIVVKGKWEPTVPDR